jgi:hypothetical protein
VPQNGDLAEFSTSTEIISPGLTGDQSFEFRSANAAAARTIAEPMC